MGRGGRGQSDHGQGPHSALHGRQSRWQRPRRWQSTLAAVNNYVCISPSPWSTGIPAPAHTLLVWSVPLVPVASPRGAWRQGVTDSLEHLDISADLLLPKSFVVVASLRILPGYAPTLTLFLHYLTGWTARGCRATQLRGSFLYAPCDPRVRRPHPALPPLPVPTPPLLLSPFILKPQLQGMNTPAPTLLSLYIYICKGHWSDRRLRARCGLPRLALSRPRPAISHPSGKQCAKASGITQGSSSRFPSEHERQQQGKKVPPAPPPFSLHPHNHAPTPRLELPRHTCPCGGAVAGA